MLQLKAFNCTKCGGSLDFAADGLRAVCKYCGTEHFFKEDKAEALIMLLNEAGEYLKRNLFDDAIAKYTAILARYPEDSEAAWGLTVSTYGIVYARDDRTGKMIPTCSRIVKKSILDFSAYKTAIESCADEQKAIYESEAQFIDRLQKKIKRAMEDEEDFDVFISFKAQDDSGAYTEDIAIARNIYNELTRLGIKTFFSDVTLSGRMGDEYEPIIYRALYSCKFFILVATDEKYVEAPWVKNEWTRFRDRVEEEGLSGSCAAVFKNIKPYSLPKIFGGQGIPLERHPFDYAQIVGDNLATKFGLKNAERDKINAALEAERKKNEEERKRNEEERRKSEEAQREMERKMRELEEQLKKSQSTQAAPATAPTATPKPQASVSKPAVPTKQPASKPEVTVGSEYLKFELSESGDFYKVSGCDKKATEVVIPKEYNGKTVKELGDDAFKECSGLKSVTIPDSVTSIGKSAFYYCTGLTSVTIENSVTSIGDHAFFRCNSLTSVTIPDSVTEIGSWAFSDCTNLTSVTIGNSVTSIGDHAFFDCKRLTSVTIGNSVTTIGGAAFQYCDNLTSVTIPDSVTSIGSSAFEDCTGLASVTIGNGVTSIGNDAFLSCNSLTSITVDEGNTAYKDIDGNLYTKDGKTLIQYAIGKKNTSFTIPDSVTSIGLRAFSGCKRLTSVTIGNSVDTIGYDAFSDCTGLTSVTIPDSVTTIAYLAFTGCTGLTSVTFCGTKAQWKNINIGKDNDSLKKAVIHCTDGDIKPGLFGKLFK